MDVTKSHDPFAPEGTDLSAEPESEAPADPQDAVSDPVDPSDAPDVSTDPADSEAQDAPVEEPAEEPTFASSAQYARDLGLNALADTIEAGEDPTSPAESDGPTEPEPVGEPEPEISEADLAAKAAATPEPQPVDEHGELIPTPDAEITDERGIDAADEPADETPEPDPTTDEETD